MKIAKLTKIDLRKLWKHEQYDFSNWLSSVDNIEELNNLLGLSLIDIKTEYAAGSFRCDLLCKDEMTGKTVLIENQLESTNHDHLGKIITYGSALDASVIVWIVKKAKSEHRNAIKWLNTHFDDEVSFFLIEVSAYRIGDSDPAPMFVIIEQPNDFVATVKTAEKIGLNASQTQRIEFWNQFNEILENRNFPFNKRKVTNNHWYDVSLGTSLCHITINLINKDNKIRIGIYIPDNKDQFDKFYSFKDEIEKELGYEIEWNRIDSSKASMISTYIQGLDFKDHSNYDYLINKSIDKVIEFKKVFKKYI